MVRKLRKDEVETFNPQDPFGETKIRRKNKRDNDNEIAVR